jgi:4-amino-4-deoxy-L-arabinose transferase-like glycosyltransferase
VNIRDPTYTIHVPATPKRDRNHLLAILLIWLVFYATYTLLTPPLLDDADSVHSEVAREMLLRHDWVTLYANGIRYLEKAPLLYWSMAASFKLFGFHTFAARLPLAFTVLALALALESFARRAFNCTRTGLYAALILLSSFGIFIFTRITIPDAIVCLWLTLALFAYYLTEHHSPPAPNPVPSLRDSPTVAKVGIREVNGTPPPATTVPRLLCYAFAAACALNVLTKGLIGIVFPIVIVLLHLLLTRGLSGTIKRLSQLHPITSTVIFFVIAAPWHIFIGLANPTQGNPGHLTFIHHHWQVPQPTLGNVHGWTWFYFINEHLLRYLNLRVPRDYDTVPLALFWGLLFIWLMPWSAFLPNALSRIPALKVLRRTSLSPRESTLLLFGLWAAIPMLFFSLSTRQEYYVLPTLPAFALLIAAWLTEEATEAEAFTVPNPLVTVGQRISVVLLVLGSLAALAAGFLALHSAPPGPNTDLASLLKQNPGDYALSFGHFLDLNAQAMGAFHDPLVLTAIALFTGTLANWFARRNYKPHTANLWLAAAAFTFLLAAHLGLQIFSPVLSSKRLAAALAPNLRPNDLIIINGEYESASTLGFYLHRPGPDAEPIHILNGRSSNLWYGSFFPDAPDIFEDSASLSLKWTGVRRIFLWQDLSAPLPPLPAKTYFITQSGGKEILSNQPNPY